MGLFRKIKSTFCCYSSKYLLDDDDDDATVVDEENEQQTLLHTEEEVSEKPLLSDSDAAALAPYLTSQTVVVKSVLRRRRSTQNTTVGDTPQRRYNVLLFGDSLTAGWCGEDGYGEYHPYGLRIQKRFEEEGLDVEVTVSGVPGECCAHMEERLKRELEQPGKWYDWVIILGGTNDVFQGYSAWDIFESLKKLYALCSKHGARVLGITIPEFDLEEANKLDYQRRIVNEHLNVLNNSTTRNTYTLFLLDKFLPMHSLTPEQRKFYWDDDGMHPTEEGYDLMGDMIFDVIYKEGKWN